MYVAPNTTIRLIKDCPLDNGYEHTLFFDKPSDQQYYFNTYLSGITFTQQSYQRVNKGKLRVAQNAESLYAVNYLSFQNAAFGTRWFYAFVTQIDYINNGVSEITYEIDILQTWHFDYKMIPVYVEREHSTIDTVGYNLVPESVELGDYIADNDVTDTGHLTNFHIVVAAPFDSQYQPTAGAMYSDIFSGLTFTAFPNTAAGAASAVGFITGAGAQADKIVSVFLMPSDFVTTAGDPVESYTISKTKKVTGAIDGYTPKNNKLYTYPYNFLYVTNLQGTAAPFPYEYFSGTACEFRLFGDMSPNPSVIMYPLNYKGVGGNLDEKMTISGYPQLPYNIDAYKAWLAQNASSLQVSALSSAYSLAQAAANPAGGAVQAVSTMFNVAHTLAERYSRSLSPLQSRGGSGSITNCAAQIQDFYFMHKHIRREFAEIIDNYFSVYGYATHKVKKPNRVGRHKWNYVKTIGCKVEAGYPEDVTAPTGTPVVGLPADDARRIEEIYNHGITFWHSPVFFGNYGDFTNTIEGGE